MQPATLLAKLAAGSLSNSATSTIITNSSTSGLCLLASALCRQLDPQSCCPTARSIAHAALQQAVLKARNEGVVDDEHPYNDSANHSRCGAAAAPHQQGRQQQQQQQTSSTADAPTVLQQWQRIAQLSPADSEWLLSQHPRLRSYLSNGQLFQTSNYPVNAARLSLHPAQLAAKQHAALRGVLALMPPSMLQPLLQQACALSELQERLLHMLGPFRLPLQHARQQQQQQEQQQQQQQQQPQGADACGQQAASTVGWAPPRVQQLRQQQPPHSPPSFQQVAEAVIKAVGLRPHDQPAQLDGVCSGALLKLIGKADVRAHSCRSDSSDTNAGSAGAAAPGSLVSGSIGSLNGTVRNISTTAMRGLTLGLSLTRALEVTGQARNLWYKPLHNADAAAQLVHQLQAATGMGQGDVLLVLLKRPCLLWQHNTPILPGQLQAVLAQLLPDLAQPARLSELVVKQPRVLSCSSQDLRAVAGMLSTRLHLSQSEAAELVLQHPALLLQPVASMVPVIGFLVGLGMTPSDLRAMALSSPKWITSSLQDLEVQWHFLQQEAKVSRQDVVLFPQLLTLSINTCLGPRVLYARKRNIKLLKPSVASVVGGSSSSSTADWIQHRMVPLQLWLSMSEQRMCRLLGLDLQDYRRFKLSWGRVYGAQWRRAR